jgi:hypothetical protein
MLIFRTVWRALTVAGVIVVGAGSVLGGATGCFGGGGDDPAFILDWRLAYVGDAAPIPTRADPCKVAGTPTVELFMKNRDTRAEVVDTFPCSDLGGRSQDLPPGTYDVELALLDTDGNAVAAQDGTFVISRRSVTDLGQVEFAIQSFVFNWSVARGNAIVRCTDVDGATVRLFAQTGNGPKRSFSWPCRDGQGVTPAIGIGTYSVQPELLNSAGRSIARTILPMTVPVDGVNRAVLPPLTFEVP